MARTAKMHMIMHGDGHGGVHHHDGLLNVNGIFKNRFDVILTNPPFGSRIEKEQKITEADRFTDTDKIAKYIERYGTEYEDALKEVNDNIGESLLSLYDTGAMSSLTEVLFIERCINLLKPGGRMGIVLPEGTLNNDNLQRVREYVEGRAKIILIVSIPQDVFMASGAMVKPSLMFFKKFTKEEEMEYADISSQARVELYNEYKEELDNIAEQLSRRGKDGVSKEDRKQLTKRRKQIDQEVSIRARKLVKQRFDYIIPIAEVEKAGISSTGKEIANELEPLENEFTPYRKQHKLWDVVEKSTDYVVNDDGTISRIRIVNGIACEPESFTEN
jgi:type I restriction enzyme M protein